ncbi:hypothetical protein N9P31_02445 [bacterium]|nr:hypothetical protein [bacterium]
MYKKNIIFLTCIFLLFGCMDKRKLNNQADAVSSIEKKKENTSPKGITFKKNADGKHVLYEGSFFNLGKKQIDQVNLPNDIDRTATDPTSKKSGVTNVFLNLWPRSRQNNDVTDQKFEQSQAVISSSELETFPETRKSMFEQFTTIVWPWEK